MANEIKPFDFSNLIQQFKGGQPEDQDFFGEHSDFLGEELTGAVKAGGMNEFLRQTLMTGTKKIGRKAGRARENIREAGASSGFKGANINAMTDLFASEAGAVEDLEVGVGGLAEANKSQAIAKLLGLTQFQGGQKLGGARLAESRRQFDASLEFQKEQADGSILGDILGFGAGIVTGGALGGVGSGVGSALDKWIKGL